MAVVHQDSVDKIVEKYFLSFTKVSFSYNGKNYTPRPLVVSANLARGTICPEACGACCFRFTLDYVPSEPKPDGLRKRFVIFNGKKIKILTDFQGDDEVDASKNDLRHDFCKYLGIIDGRCGIYPVRPFSCDIELVRCYMSEKMGRNRIGVGPYGRAWNMTKTDSTKGVLCEITPPSAENIQDTIRKFSRLEKWFTHFGLKIEDTWLDEVREFLVTTRGECGNKLLDPERRSVALF